MTQQIRKASEAGRAAGAHLDGPGVFARGVALSCGAAIVLLATTSAFAADAPHAGASDFLFLVQIVVLIVLGRALGETMQRIGQPSTMGLLLAGILLGPSALGALAPEAQKALFPPAPEQKAMIDAVSQVGILMLLLLAGMETDLALVKRVKRAALAVSVAGIAAPFAAGFVLGQFLPDSLLPHPEGRLVMSLFLGTALSISSVKIVATVVREMNFLRRNVGQVILASAIIDDTIGWIIISIIFGLASQSEFDWMSLTKSVLGTLVFLAVSFTIGRRIVARLIRWTNDHFVSEAAVISVIFVIMGTMALTTHLIGVHTVLGAFVAGILVGDSPILTRQIDEELRGLTAGLFMPVFFGVAGLSTDLTILKNSDLALLTVGLILIASVGKAAGAFTGGWIGGLSRRECVALAAGMNARGSTEVIVATIGLSMGLISQNLFTMIVAMAVVTTMAMPPSLRWALNRLPLGKDERKRLEREDFEETAFVPSLERILVAADESAKGKFASRVAGLLAGLRGMPVTVLKIESPAESKTKAEKESAAGNGKDGSKSENVEAATDAAEEGKAADPHQKAKGAAVDVIEQQHDATPHEAVKKEAEKGHDLLLVGIEPTEGGKGGFDDKVSAIARGFAGALAVVIARGVLERDPLDSELSILVATDGSAVSQRGAELAIVLAKAAGAKVAALVVTRPGAGTARQRLSVTRVASKEILKEVAALAKHYDVSVDTVERTGASAAEAILREARQGGHDLIVIGASRRPGEKLSFGSTAAAILESSDRSIMFVSS